MLRTHQVRTFLLAGVVCPVMEKRYFTAIQLHCSRPDQELQSDLIGQLWRLTCTHLPTDDRRYLAYEERVNLEGQVGPDYDLLTIALLVGCLIEGRRTHSVAELLNSYL